MSCQYSGKCSDEDVLCDRCINSDYRSYFVAYHEYPADKGPEGTGDGFYFKCPDKREPLEKPYPSPTSEEWPYLPSQEDGYDLPHPLSTWVWK